MSNMLIQEITLSDKGYSSGVKKAIEAVQELGRENGVAASSVGNVTKEMKSAQKYAMTLANTYRGLSEEAKQTDWGKAIEQEMNAAIQKAGELSDLKSDIARQVKNIASDTRPWDTMNEAVGVFANGMQVAAGAIGAFTGDERTAMNMMNLASAAQGTLNTITALGNALQKESNIMATVAAVKSKAAAIAKGLETAATEGSTVATKAATVAQKAFNVVANANPYVLLATAAIAAGAAIWGFVEATQKSEFEEAKEQAAEEEHKKSLQEVQEYYDKTGRSVEGLEVIQSRQPAVWQQLSAEALSYKKSLQAAKEEHDKLGDSTGDLVSKFMTLQTEWQGLRTEAEKKKFIEDNKNAFNELGLSVNTLNDAYNALVKNAPAVIAALKAMAEAEAYKDLYKDAVKKRETEWNNRAKSRKTGDYYTKVSSDEKEQSGLLMPKEWQTAGLNYKTDYTTEYENEYSSKWKLTKAGEAKLNKYRSNQAYKTNQTLKQSYDKDVNHYAKALEEKERAAIDAEKKLATLGTKIDAQGVIAGGGKSGKTNKTKTGKTSSNTTKETPLETFNNTNKEIEAKLKNDLIDEEEAINQKIKAIDTYCDALLKDGKVTDKDREELARLKPVLTNLRKKLKALKIQNEDYTIIKNANQSYADTISKLNTDRKNGWVTEEEYADEYKKALQDLVKKYQSVTNVTDELKKEINDKIAEIDRIDLSKAVKEFDKTARAVSEDIGLIITNNPKGNAAFENKRTAQNNLRQKEGEYDFKQKFTTKLGVEFTGLDEAKQVAKIIETIKGFNGDTRLTSFVNQKELDIITGIQDGVKLTDKQLNTCKTVVDRIIKDIQGNNIDFLNLDDTQQQLVWMQHNLKKVSLTPGVDGKEVANITRIADVSKASQEQLALLQSTIDKVKKDSSQKWDDKWLAEYKTQIDKAYTYTSDFEHQIETLDDAITNMQVKTIVDKWFQNMQSVSDLELLKVHVEVDKDDAKKEFDELKKEFNKLQNDLEGAGYNLLSGKDPQNLLQIEQLLGQLKEETLVKIGVDPKSLDDIKKKLHTIAQGAITKEVADEFAKVGDEIDFNAGLFSPKEDPKVIQKYIKNVQRIIDNTSFDITVGLSEEDATEIQDEADEIQKKVQKAFDEAKLKVDFEADPQAIEDLQKAVIDALKELDLPEDVFKNLESKINKSTTKALKKPKIPNAISKGDRSNYSTNATSYEQLSKSATNFDYDSTKLEKQQKYLDELLDKYKDIEDELNTLNEKGDAVGIDTSEFTNALESLENEINKTHDDIAKKLKFQVRLDGIDDIAGGISSLASFGNTLATLKSSWEQAGDAENEFSEIMQKTMIVMEVVEGVIAAINTVQTIGNAIQAITNTGKIAGTVAAQGEATAETEKQALLATGIATNTAAAASNKILEESLLDVAAASIFAAHASIPFAGVGIASGLISGMLGAMAGFTASAAAVSALANGGIVGEGNFHGDTTLIRANKGEMVLNTLQQKNLFDALDNGFTNNLGGGEVEFKLRGQELIGLMKNYNSKKSKLS